MAADICRWTPAQANEQGPLPVTSLHGMYSGSQKYLPTFEPTLHQDFWLCLC